MVHPQIININTDSVIVIDGAGVINDSTQLELSLAPWGGADIKVDINLYDITAGSAVALIDEVDMTYEEDADIWIIPVSAIEASLIDRHKYIARVSEGSTTTSGPAVMRDFKIQDFSVDNDSFEDTIMRLPFQVEIGSPSYMKWYEDNTWAVEVFRAEVYEGNVGNTPASSSSKITHRGPIVPAP